MIDQSSQGFYGEQMGIPAHQERARSSVGEHILHTDGVASSILAAPTSCEADIKIFCILRMAHFWRTIPKYFY